MVEKSSEQQKLALESVGHSLKPPVIQKAHILSTQNKAQRDRVNQFKKNLQVDIKQEEKPALNYESPKPPVSLYLQEYDEKQDSNFRLKDATEYFRTIFKDVAARSLTPRTEEHPAHFIDNVAFFEWTKLPGIICDRFFQCFKMDKPNIVTEEAFVKVFLVVYISTIQEKMELTFKM